MESVELLRYTWDHGDHERFSSSKAFFYIRLFFNRWCLMGRPRTGEVELFKGVFFTNELSEVHS